jgi:hypothetical protein
MTVHNLESRILKLETRTARPGEMLVVWRKPGGNVSEALEAATFSNGDKVICAEWFDDDQPPAPRWYGSAEVRSWIAGSTIRSIARSSAWPIARKQSGTLALMEPEDSVHGA